MMVRTSPREGACPASLSAVMNEESHGKDVKKIIKGLVVPYEVKAELKTPLYSEPLSARGDIKLTVSKDK